MPEPVQNTACTPPSHPTPFEIESFFIFYKKSVVEGQNILILEGEFRFRGFGQF